MNKVLTVSIFAFLSGSSALAAGTVAPANTPANTPVATAAAEKVFTMKEVAAHATIDSCWFIVKGVVYDVTQSIAKHPGGKKAILANCGKDATAAFETRGGKSKHSAKAHGYLESDKIGMLKM
jgi:cytochrome b involved in lipid metabolism